MEEDGIVDDITAVVVALKHDGEATGVGASLSGVKIAAVTTP